MQASSLRQEVLRARNIEAMPSPHSELLAEAQKSIDAGLVSDNGASVSASKPFLATLELAQAQAKRIGLAIANERHVAMPASCWPRRRPRTARLGLLCVRVSRGWARSRISRAMARATVVQERSHRAERVRAGESGAWLLVRLAFRSAGTVSGCHRCWGAMTRWRRWATLPRWSVFLLPPLRRWARNSGSTSLANSSNCVAPSPMKPTPSGKPDGWSVHQLPEPAGGQVLRLPQRPLPECFERS